ncbi:MAG: hypothetical protein QW041_01385 [Candidatus Pacearchaeota archaeon]
MNLSEVYKNKYFEILLLLFLGLILVIIFSIFVPYNMDEFAAYHLITCYAYKYNYLNIFNEGCTAYFLNFLNTGLMLPLRTYFYMGSLPSLYYLPLFLIWKSPVSARFLGIIFLVIQSLILSTIFKIKTRYIFSGLILFFPYFFKHIVDPGLAGFQITAVFLIVYLFIKWNEKFKITYLLLASVVIFLGIWTNLTFVWFIPSLIILFITQCIENKKRIIKKNNLKKIVIQLFYALILLLGLLSLLFLSFDLNNKPYLYTLISSDNSKVYSINEMLDVKNYIINSPVFQALINPFLSTKEIYMVESPSYFVYVYDIFIYLSIPLLWLILVLKKKSKTQILKSIIFFALFIFTVIIIIWTKAAWEHHAVMAYPFLILSFLTAVKTFKETDIIFFKINFNKIMAIWLILFMIVNCYFFFSFQNQHLIDHDNPPKRQMAKDLVDLNINKLLYDPYLAENYFYVITEWGMYRYQALYGNKNQGVFYIEPLNTLDQINLLKDISKKYNRKLLFVYHTGQSSVSNYSLIQESFFLKQCNAIKNNSKWKIMLELDNSSKNICFK